MKIRIISFSKGREKNLKILEDDYQARLGRFYSIETLDLAGSKGVEKDWQNLQKKIGKDKLILLDEKGKSVTSHELAHHWNQWLLGGRNLSFVIGGAHGFPEVIKSKVDFRLSLSSLTFPHRWVRLILLEALYRADDILKGGPYHKEGDST